MRGTIADAEFDRARDVMTSRCGLRFDARNRELLEAGLVRAASSHGLTVAQLIDHLQCDPRESLPQSVLREVTIAETYFFRHPEHFEAVRELVVPSLLERRRDTRQIRAWSAGCATGEETWSLAMTLAAGMGTSFECSVLGTDINREALAVAERGRYGRWAMRHGVPAIAGCLSSLADGSVQVTPTLQKRVRFRYLNLHDPIYPSLITGTQGLDVILCRNVLMYFFPETATAIFRRLTECLAEGGYLIVGALDLDYAPAGLERIRHGGSVLLRRGTRVFPRARVPERRSPPREILVEEAAPDPALVEAKAAADRGELEMAIALGRKAVAVGRAPHALHLLALILAERGDSDEPIALLREACERAPDYALAHLALALHEGSGPPADRARRLRLILSLLEGRPATELLPGPDPLPVSWVCKMARAALQKLEGS